MSHWLALVGGAAVVVVLGLYERFANTTIPRAWYAVLIGSFLGWAVFLAWQDEWQRAELLAMQRPQLVMSNPGIEQYTAAGGQLLPRYGFRVQLRNSTAIPAIDLSVRFIVAPFALNGPPYLDRTVTDANPIMDQTVTLRTPEAQIGANVPRHFVMAFASYRDERTKRQFYQGWYTWWEGSNAQGVFVTHFNSASLQQRASIDTYLRDTVGFDATPYHD